MKIVDKEQTKHYRSDICNFNFDKTTGYTEIWGKTLKEDPIYCPDGPMILDIEITDICYGIGSYIKNDKIINGNICKFCYKSNTPHNQTNMSFEQFKTILDKMPKTLTQIAFGADSSCIANPDLFKMMAYTRDNGVIPNITVADITDEIADQLVELCGGIAVSRYKEKDYCYNSVKKLIDRGQKQTNIHIMVSEETYNDVIETFQDYLTDDRLKGLNAIVLLSLKKKGRGKTFTALSQDKFNEMVNTAFKYDIPLGFDSCSYHKFIESVKDHPQIDKFKMMSEPCESFGLFSSYINCNGDYYPCSFVEGEDEWSNGLSVLNCNDFLKDIWYHPLLVKWRGISLKMDRKCPIFNI